jgi:transcription factor E2F4/5
LINICLLNDALQWIQQSFRNTSEDNVNSRLAYITHDDLCSSFEGDTLLAIRAPPHTHLEVPIPEDDQVRVCTQIFEHVRTVT